MSSYPRSSLDRGLPYLHRNWIMAVNHPATPFSRSADQNGRAGVHGRRQHSQRSMMSDLDQDSRPCGFSRPSKRRRLSLDDDQGPQSSTRASKSDTLNPILLDDPAQAKKALRIEVLKITHKESSRVRGNQVVNGSTPFSSSDPETRSLNARCKVTLFTRVFGVPEVLYADSQLCNVKSFKNPVGPHRMARVYLPRPFELLEEKILVSGNGCTVFELAERYTLLIELSSAGDPSWPPLDLAGRNMELYNCEIPSNYWVMIASIDDIFETDRKPLPLRVKVRPRLELPSDFALDVELRWSTGLSARLSSSIIADRKETALPSITVQGLDGGGSRPPTTVSQHDHGQQLQLAIGRAHAERPAAANGDKSADYVMVDDGYSRNEGAEFAPRNRRGRAVQSYNLKHLSDQAAGRDARPRRKEGRIERAHAEYHKITYLLPPEQVAVDYFACCICMAVHHSLSQLQAHVLLSHPQYQFGFNPGEHGNTVITVRHRPSADNAAPIRPPIYQLGTPRQTFYLEKFVDGDNSWISSRLGPDNEYEFPPRKALGRTRSAQKSSSRPAGGREKVLRVPKARQPLYDPLSKVELKPGAIYRPIVADDTWLVQKHGDIMNDFHDVEPDEKEYIKVWDAYMKKHRVSTEVFLARTFLDFARERAAWIAATKERGIEYGKHIAVLLARNLIDEHHLAGALRYIDEARARTPARELQKLALARNPISDCPKYTSVGECVECGKLVRGPSMLVCSNKACTKRLYHDDCVRSTALVPVNTPNWKCNSCFRSRES